VLQLEVGFELGLLARLRLAEVGRFAKMVSVQLLEEGLVGGLGEHALLLKDGEDTHGLEEERRMFSFGRPAAIYRIECFVDRSVASMINSRCFCGVILASIGVFPCVLKARSVLTYASVLFLVL